MTQPTLIHAFGITLPAGLPDEIQWMPPGTHEITTRGADGEPVTHQVRVGSAAAVVLQQQLQTLRSAAAAGQEDLPYLDFNHDDREASARVLAFSWGGEDPVAGGVRAKVEWTGAGRRALEDKSYRRFSPSFFLNAAGEVTGAPLNMGGLVNKAAFKNINPIVAGAAGDANHRKVNMDPNEKLAADLAAERQKVIELSAKLAEATNDQTIKAKDAEITQLKDQVNAKDKEIKAAALRNAEAIVAKAVEDTLIAPQNTEEQKEWVNIISEHPERAKLLTSRTPLNAKLGTVIPNGNGGAAAGAATQSNTAVDFVTTVNAKCADGKVTKGQALDLVIAEKPQAYEAWRAADCKPGL